MDAVVAVGEQLVDHPDRIGTVTALGLDAAGWYQDPISPADGRYWDGTRWTDSVSRAGQTIVVPIDEQRAALPPIPGSELRPAAPPATPPPVPSVTVNSSGSSGLSAGGIVVSIVALVVAVVVVVVIVATANGNDSNDEQPPATPAPTEAPAEAPPSSEGG